MPLPHKLTRKVLLHIDLDAFYAQVEQVRLGLPRDEPLAVQQWNGLIAVNYPSRAFGVKRHTTPAQALEKCPHIRLVHVATFGNGEAEPRYHDNPSAATHKVSLEPYRRASQAIFKIFKSYPNVIVQKAGIDEAFMDVSGLVRSRMDTKYADTDEARPPKVDWTGLGVIIVPEAGGARMEGGASEAGGEKVRGKADKAADAPVLHQAFGNWEDVMLAEGARFALEVRKRVFDELHYTCSAGVVLDSKVLAKLCSARNKPNNQSVLRPSKVLSFIKEVPLSMLWSMGGKFGNRVETELNVTTCGDVWQFSLGDLQRRFGDSEGAFLYDVVRGIDKEEVTVRGDVKSMMAAKSLRSPATDAQQAEHWLGILSSELFTRLRDDFERWPRTLVLHYTPTEGGRDRSRSGPFPSRDDVTCPDDITRRAMRLLLGQQYVSGGSATAGRGHGQRHEIPSAFSCSRFALSATGLEKVDAGKNRSIEQFFAKGAPQTSPGQRAMREAGISPSHQRVWQKTSTAPRGIAAFFKPNAPATTTLTVAVPEEGKAAQPEEGQRSFRDAKQMAETRCVPPVTTLTAAVEEEGKAAQPEEGQRSFRGAKQTAEIRCVPPVMGSEAPGMTGGKEAEVLWTCEKCRRRFAREMRAEHEDYHFALELAKSDRAARISPSVKPSECSAPDRARRKRRSSGAAAPKSTSSEPKRRKEDFFAKQT